MRKNLCFQREVRKQIKAREKELRELKELRNSCGQSINTDMLDLEIQALEDDILSLKANLDRARR